MFNFTFALLQAMREEFWARRHGFNMDDEGMF